MQVGDALVGVDHGQRWTHVVDSFDVGFDLRLLLSWQGLDAGVQVADTVVQVEADLFQYCGVLVQRVLVVLGNDLAEHDRVGDLHHGGFQVHRQQHALGFGIFDLGGDELAQRLGAQDCAVDDFTGLDRGFFFQNGGVAVLVQQFDAQAVIGVDQRGFLAAVEVALAHVCHVGLGVGSPGAHLVRVLACVVLDRQRGATVGVAFTQDRVHGAALDAVVASLGFFLGIGSGGFRVIRNVEALGLQFLDRGLQLRNRGADVRQLDDVGFWCGCQLAQFCQMVGHLLVGAELFREGRKDTAGQRDVPGFYGDVGASGEGFDDGEQ
ncbi:hypothetical protein D3C78_981980 [compost metagenome]